VSRPQKHVAENEERGEQIDEPIVRNVVTPATISVRMVVLCPVRWKRRSITRQGITRAGLKFLNQECCLCDTK